MRGKGLLGGRKSGNKGMRQPSLETLSASESRKHREDGSSPPQPAIRGLGSARISSFFEFMVHGSACRVDFFLKHESDSRLFGTPPTCNGGGT